MTTSEVPGFTEVAPVRPGEDLDWVALERYLRDTIPGLVGEFSVLQFPNGSANLTYRVAFGDRQLVVRRPPLGQLAIGSHDMKREHRALSGLWVAYDRAPKPLAYTDDVSIVGAEFLVIEYRSGVVIWGSDTVPPVIRAMPDHGHRIGMSLIDALIDLHLVDIHHTGLINLGKPEGFLERQLRGWRRRWDAVSDVGPDHPLMEGLADRLFERVPVSPPPTVLHNDFKLDNCQFSSESPDRVISVFDWDMATVGDPLVDLGTLLNYLPDPDGQELERVAIPGLESLGLPSRQTIVERYAARTGTDVGSIHWYEAYGIWKTAVIMQQLYARYARGETSDERMGTRADRMDGVAARALDLLGGG
ncbi:phosphotransferase family protein [Longivirga aurantiaca]|uniref:Phosphotransferase family protein n=1 Tax=Longivirga aurantiaca TaxID=1837743 RepID=A0ABW1T4P1_9ACTN